MTTESGPSPPPIAEVVRDGYLGLIQLRGQLSLSQLEFDLLLCMLSASLHPDHAVRLQELQQEPIAAGVRSHTLSRALGLGGVLTAPLLQALAPERPLRSFGLLVRSDTGPSSAAFERFVIPREVVGLALGRPGISPLVEQAGELSLGRAEQGQELHPGDARILLRGLFARKSCALLARDLVSLRTGLAGIAASMSLQLLWVTVDDLKGDLLRDALRDALLHGAVLTLCLSLEPSTAASEATRERLQRLARRAQRAGVPLVFVTPQGGSHLGDFELHVRPPERSLRHSRWESALAERELVATPATVGQAAEQFRMGLHAIERAADRLAATRLSAANQAPVSPADLGSAVAAELAEVAAGTGEFLPEDAALNLDDLKLPDDVAEDLQDLLARCRYRHQLFADQRLARLTTSTGVVALFTGPPGTGKTMAARLLCAHLGLKLLRIDLSRLVSKWIGETEKNLAQVLDAAEDGLFAVLFDEADSLFGARTSNVQSSTDRYANMQTNYLLQRLDTFQGVAFLTSNFERGIDEAFKRRLTARVEFPMPDEETRTAIWRSLIPPSLRMSAKALHGLARTELSGGYIRNAVLRAAFRSARLGRPLRQRDLTEAVVAELRSQGRLADPPRYDSEDA